jgi:hypothetical protein
MQSSADWKGTLRISYERGKRYGKSIWNVLVVLGACIIAVVCIVPFLFLGAVDWMYCKVRGRPFHIEEFFGVEHEA